MLVLTRREQDGIAIGPVVITIVKIKGKQVRIGIECAKDIPISRLNSAGQIEERQVEPLPQKEPT